MSILALVLLGLCEIVAIDVSANFIVIHSLAGNGIFLAVSGLIAFFSAAVICWAVLKAMEPGCAHADEGMRNGAVVGAISAIFICAFMLAMGFAGAGLEKLMQAETFSQQEKIGTYALSCAVIMLAYTLEGAILGALVYVASEKFIKKEKQVIHLNAAPVHEPKNEPAVPKSI